MHDTTIDTIRRFNRFYTRRIGVLREGLLDSKFTLTESRLLWELAHADGLTATDLSRTLELDTGYLSRLLTGLKERGLIKRARVPPTMPASSTSPSPPPASARSRRSTRVRAPMWARCSPRSASRNNGNCSPR